MQENQGSMRQGHAGENFVNLSEMGGGGNQGGGEQRFKGRDRRASSFCRGQKEPPVFCELQGVCCVGSMRLGGREEMRVAGGELKSRE